jgi:hypothetical protein
VLSAIFLCLISCGAIVAGVGYVRTARRMRDFATTRGKVIARAITTLPTGAEREGRWGKGGGYMPKITYAYTVGSASYTNDRLGYAYRGLKKSIAEAQSAATPDEVDVHYDPANPQESYLEKHSPRIGKWLIAGGIVGVLFSLVLALG